MTAQWLDVDVVLRRYDEVSRGELAPAGWAVLAEILCRFEEDRPVWQRDALCLEYPDVPFFVERGESSEPAKAVCSQCLVADECTTYAVQNGLRHGIWGGQTGSSLLANREDRSAAPGRT